MEDGAQETLGKASPSPEVLAGGPAARGRKGRGSWIHSVSSTRGGAVPREPQGWAGGQGSGGGAGPAEALLTQGCRDRGPCPVWPAGPQAKLCCLHGLGAGPRAAPMAQGPQGGGKAGQTKGRQTPKLSTKNGRFEPCARCPCRSKRGQRGLPARARPAVGFTRALLHIEFPQELRFEKRAEEEFEKP